MSENPFDYVGIQTNRKGNLEIDGEVTEVLPSTTFKVKLQNEMEVRARLSGKMRMHRIIIVPGDKVRVELSSYDLTKGRLVYRY
jgi:translation initiation factor IF-1